MTAAHSRLSRQDLYARDLHARDLPRWVQDLILCPPAAGTGLHAWIYRCACALKPWRSPADIVALLIAATAGCGRDVTREVHEAVRLSRNDWQPGLPPSALTLPPPARAAWPARNLDEIAAVVAAGGGMADLWEASPNRLEGEGPDAEEIVDMLFPPDALLCVAKKAEDAWTRPRAEWRGKLSSHSLIVPSPMKSLTGRNKSGHTSRRCLDNTGPRRFLVVEFDFKAEDAHGRPTPEAPLLAQLAREGLTVPDLCAALLLQLGKFAPLLLAVHSGGKSLHGWFPAAGETPETLARFFRTAVRLGADPATWSRCQLIRLPEGRRDNGRRQCLSYLDSRALSRISPQP